jgi:hypothetical protein
MNTLPLTIVTSNLDNTTECIFETIKEDWTVNKTPELIELLQQEVKQGTRGHWSSLDLVGHTGDESYVQIGRWVISECDDDEDEEDEDPADDNMKKFVLNELKPLLLHLKITGLRLLGCGSASTAKSFETMQALAKWLRAGGHHFTVYGTSTVIDETDFGEDGFSSVGKLYSSDNPEHSLTLYITRETFGDPLAVELDLDRLRPDEIDPTQTVRWPRTIVPPGFAERILDLIERGAAWSLRGLLALPSHEILIPVQDSGRYRRMQILLNHQIVRVFSLPLDDHPCLIYRVKDPESLASLLRSFQ